jgi:hypothetical protein
MRTIARLNVGSRAVRVVHPQANFGSEDTNLSW